MALAMVMTLNTAVGTSSSTKGAKAILTSQVNITKSGASKVDSSASKVKSSVSQAKKSEVTKTQLTKKQNSTRITLAKRVHDYRYTKTIFPEKDNYSYKVYKCTVCGATKKTVIENPGSGYVGTLVIDAVNLKVRVYDVYKTNPHVSAQTITDRKNSATMIELNGQVFIADHKHQGFSKIKKVTAGKTIATLGSKTYKCVQKFNGRNKEYYLTDNNGTDIKKYGADIAMYTCNQDWRHVTITLWNEIE